MEQMRQHKPGRPGADNPDLRTHSSSPASECKSYKSKEVDGQMDVCPHCRPASGRNAVARHGVLVAPVGVAEFRLEVALLAPDHAVVDE